MRELPILSSAGEWKFYGRSPCGELQKEMRRCLLFDDKEARRDRLDNGKAGGDVVESFHWGKPKRDVVY